MKMDRYQSKGVAGGAFCKRLKRNGMDGGKLRICQEKERRVTPEFGIGRAGAWQTRKRIAEKYPACQLLYWYRSNELWKKPYT
jgi:hypothetical protein